MTKHRIPFKRSRFAIGMYIFVVIQNDEDVSTLFASPIRNLLDVFCTL